MVNKDKKVERKRGEDTAKSCGSDSNPGLCFLAMWQMGACSPPELNQHNLCAFSCVRAFSSEKEALGEEKEHDILLRCRWHCLFPLCFCFFGKGDPFSDDKMSVWCLIPGIWRFRHGFKGQWQVNTCNFSSPLPLVYNVQGQSLPRYRDHN